MNRWSSAGALIVLALLLAGLLVTAGIYRSETAAAEASGKEIGQRAVAHVEDIVRATEIGLQGTGALFDASNFVDADEFATFTRHQIERGGITSTGFLEAVDASERGEWESRNGAPISDITPEGLVQAGPRSRYYPITYAQTPDGPGSTGADLSSSPARRLALERAIDAGTPHLSQPVDLITGERGVVMFSPIYEDGVRPQTSALRRSRLVGLVTGVYRTESFGASIADGIARGQSVEIRDRGESLLTIGEPLDDGNAISTSVTAAGRTWTVRTGPVPEANMAPVIVAGIGGLGAALAVLALIVTLARRERYANDQVERRMGERDAAEKARAEADSRFRSVVATMSDGLIVRGEDGGVLASNAAAERILGLSEAELQSGDVVGGAGRVLTDEAGNRLKRSTLPSARALATRTSQEAEIVGISDRQGGLTWLSVSADPMFDDGDAKPYGVVTCFTDITPQMNAQEELRRERDHWAALIDALQDGMIHTDADGVIIEVNPRFCAMTGFTLEQLVGASAPYPFWPEEDEALARLTESLSAGWRGELDAAYCRADGTALPVIVAGSPLRDDRGRLAGVVLTVKDATERQRVDRAKDEFVSVVSHELRTPLTSIHGALGVLAEGQGERLDDTGRHLLDIANRNTERLSHLINHVLDLEQITAGKDRGEFRTTPAGALIVQAADLLGPLAAENSVAFQVAPVSEHIAVICDADRIAQVLTNFLSNAIKFSPGGSTVTLDASRVGDEVHFSVRDEGRGIPEDELERIFERFHQVDSTDRRLAEGAGLGLAISERIAALHGGRVWAESTVDEGSTFILSLPVAPVDEGFPDIQDDGAPVLETRRAA